MRRVARTSSSSRRLGAWPSRVRATSGGDDAPEDRALRAGRGAVRVHVPARLHQGLHAAAAEIARQRRRCSRSSVRHGRGELGAASRRTTPRRRSTSPNPATCSTVDLRGAAPGQGHGLGGRRAPGRRSSGRCRRVVYPLEKIDEGREGRLVYAFSGPTQYFLRCEWDIDGEATIPGGCDQIQSTLEPLAAAVPAAPRRSPRRRPRRRPAARAGSARRRRLSAGDGSLATIGSVAPCSTVGDDRGRYSSRRRPERSARSARRAAGLGREPDRWRTT